MYYTRAFRTSEWVPHLFLYATLLPPVCIETPSGLQKVVCGAAWAESLLLSLRLLRYLPLLGVCVYVRECVCARGGSAPQCSVGPRQHKVTSNDSSLYDLFIYYTGSVYVCVCVGERKKTV